jgi:aspartyl-tRNA(Asn)/glutamyl-tRNA(Gln) amidotransferase subunit A
VARLRRAGAIVAGKAAMHQLAWGMTGQSPGYPPCRNPLDPSRQPGGSSSGSAAAVSAGIVPLALGTDSGGSVRQPAAWCGVVGIKPALGSIPLTGCAPMAPSLDTGGVLARSVRDCKEALAALTGRPPPSATRTEARVGVLESAFDGVAADVEHACRDALGAWAAAGAELVEIEFAWERRTLGRIYAAEFAASWGAAVDTDPRLFGDDIHAGVSTGRRILAADYLGALALVERLREQSSARASSVNVIASPSVPILPPPLDAPDSVVVAGRNTRVFNGLGWPALTLPCGRAEGLSVGLQLAALPGRDSELLALAESLESLLAGSGA